MKAGIPAARREPLSPTGPQPRSRSGSRPRLAFLTAADPRDQRAWSSAYFCMAQALQRQCGEISLLGPVQVRILTIIGKAFNLASRRVLGRGCAYFHTIAISRAYGRAFSKKLKRQGYDVIFAPNAAAEIAFLQSDVPIIYQSGATFALLHNYYPNFSRLWGFSARAGNLIEQRAIGKASALVYPSEWAADSAIRHYQADPNRIHILQSGANLTTVPEAAQVLGRPATQKCRLLFVGVDWVRKGGPVAFETLIRLRELGIDAELLVCGCTPPVIYAHDKLTVFPYLDKNRSDQRRDLTTLFMRANFLLLPTRQENYGFVLCEANAFGVPVVATRTGGISSIVIDGLNGYLLPVSATGADYAELIARVYMDGQQYERLVRGSRREYEERLNWDTWAIGVREVVEGVVEGAHGKPRLQ